MLGRPCAGVPKVVAEMSRRGSHVRFCKCLELAANARVFYRLPAECANVVFAMERFVPGNPRVRPCAGHSIVSLSILCVVLVFPSIREFYDGRNAMNPSRGSDETVLLHSGGSAEGPAGKGTLEGN